MRIVSTKKNQKAIPWQECLGKTYKCKDGVKPGRTVLDHCSIVGHVAARIVASYPKALQTSLFPKNAALLASLHDIGKVTPAFQNKLADSIKDTTKSSLTNFEERYQYHGGATYISLRDQALNNSLALALGSHHRPLIKDDLDALSSKVDLLGGLEWNAERIGLFNQLQQTFGDSIDTEMPSWQANLLGGLTQQADWIGSGDRFANPKEKWEPLIEPAVQEAGYHEPQITVGLSFQDIFGFEPRTVQKKFYESVQAPGIYILEAPMGLGKTEASLYAAYQVLSRGLANGLYFALPTCLTSEKIHERVNSFLAKITSTDKEMLHLITGKARFSDGGEFDPGRSWFSHYHRRILDHFAVGTLDQALLATLINRRSMVSLSALAGKVVILDEVHSYDVYTQTLLARLIQTLQMLHCTVIVLSATLCLNMRKGLLNVSKGALKNSAYPLLTSKPLKNELVEIPLPDVEGSNVKIVLIEESGQNVIDEAIHRAMNGEQVLWIENSVGDAQTIYSIFSARLAESRVEVGLLHSRFLPLHRAEIEEKWVNIYGKDGYLRRSQSGRILVGTQVLEQSIDIDSDFLVTRLAPMDMLLQRMGRLWRHTCTPRPISAKRECWVLVPDNEDKVSQAFSASFIVYYPYILLRTWEALRSFSGGSIQLPQDIRPLIDAVYSERIECPDSLLAKRQYEMWYGTKYQMGTRQKENRARLNTVMVGQTATRLGNATQQVLLFRSIERVLEKKWSKFFTLDDKEFELMGYSESKADRVLKARMLEKCLLRVPESRSLPTVSLSVLESLNLTHYLYCSEDENISIGLVDAEGRVKFLGNNSDSGFYCYNYESQYLTLGLRKLGSKK